MKHRFWKCIFICSFVRFCFFFRLSIYFVRVKRYIISSFSFLFLNNFIMLSFIFRNQTKLICCYKFPLIIILKKMFPSFFFLLLTSAYTRASFVILNIIRLKNVICTKMRRRAWTMNNTEWLPECLRRIRVFGMPVIARSHLIIGNTFSFGRNNSNIFFFFVFFRYSNNSKNVYTLCLSSKFDFWMNIAIEIDFSSMQNPNFVKQISIRQSKAQKHMNTKNYDSFKCWLKRPVNRISHIGTSRRVSFVILNSQNKLS